MNQIAIVQNLNNLVGLQRKTQVLDSFLKQFQSVNTRKAYRKDLEEFFAFCELRSVQITDVIPAMITDFLYSNDAWGPSSKNRVLASLKSFYKWLEVNDFTRRNPLKAVSSLKTSVKAPTQAFADEEVQKVIDAADVTKIRGNYHRLVLVLLFQLGLRRSEVVSIRLCDIVEERGYTLLHINRKGGKVQRIPLNRSITSEIQDYLNRYKELTGNLIRSDDFLSQKNSTICDKPVDPSTILRIVKRYAKIVGVDRRVSPHSCRATAISHLLENNVSIRNVADFAGHSSTVTTQLYDKKRDGYANSAAFEINYGRNQD